jgi:hypothetical protein
MRALRQIYIYLNQHEMLNFFPLCYPLQRKEICLSEGDFSKISFGTKTVGKDSGHGRTQPTNFPSPPCNWSGRGSKESITRKSPINKPSLAPCPHAGEKEQGRAVPSNFPIPTPADRPGWGKSRQIIKISVSFCPLLKWGEQDQYLEVIDIKQIGKRTHSLNRSIWSVG